MSLQVCKFASPQAWKFAGSKVCTQKMQKKIQKAQFNELGQYDNGCSTINWCAGLDEPSDWLI